MFHKAIFTEKPQSGPKIRSKGQKIDQIRTKWHPTCWGNPPILSLELLRESINSVLRPTEGIHFLTISASDLLRESTDSVIGATEGIHQFCHLTYWGNPHEYIFHTDGRISSITKLSGHLLFSSLPLEAHVVAICLRVHLSNFGH